MDKNKKTVSKRPPSPSTSLSMSDAEEEDPHFQFGDEFEEEMDNFWKDEKPIKQEEIDNFFEQEDEGDEYEEGGIEGLENLDEEEMDQILLDEQETAELAEQVALLQAMQEEKTPLILDRDNVDKLINMVSRVRLSWPEDLPGYDALEYATDPERAKLRESFYHNTDKEKTVLWHAENFRRQFQAQFPRRRALVIAPKNECGTQKLFPTFINPCVLGYPEFLDAITTAEFFKQFLATDFLEHPTKFPSRIRSHVTVLKDRQANCFEYAIILASFLIGVGYDAYVVDGYASKVVCTMDATEDYVEPPEITEDEIMVLLPPKKEIPKPVETTDSKMDFFASLFKEEEEEDNKIRPVSPSKYRFKRAVVQVASQVGDTEAESEMEDSIPEHSDLDEDLLGLPGTTEDEEEEMSDTEEEEEGQDEETSIIVRKKRKRPSCPEKYYATRTHAWILVKAGKRGVDTSFFIEPFQACIDKIEDENYFGVETVFNHKNLWVSLEDPMDLYAGEISYDLDDASKWGKLLVEAEKKKKPKEVEATNLFQDEEDDQPKKAQLYLDMPVSWTSDPDIPQEDYDRKYPGGKKTFNYNNAIVELAAPYVNDDGLVRKVLKFKGTARDPDDLIYIEEKFENRKDKLTRRKWFRVGRVLHEYFDKGRKDALKEHVHISGKNNPSYPRDLYYYANAHPQCVSHRQILRKGMVENFEGRDDQLYYRFTSYSGVICDAITNKLTSNAEEGQAASKSKARQFLEMLKGNNPQGKKRVRKKISKIIEKYHRDESKEVGDDIAEKYMLIGEGCLRILFHYGFGNLTRHSLEFFKPKGSNPDLADFHPEDCIEYLEDPHLPPTDVYRKFKLLQRLEADQRVARVLAAQAEEDVFETVTSRIQEDFRHEIEPDAFAGERNEEYMKMKEANLAADDEEEGEEDFNNLDFAIPYFEKFGVPTNRVEEVVLKKRIMLNTKVRLVKKAHSIKEAYETESTRVLEKMRWYDRHVDKMTQQEQEDFMHAYKDRIFAMHIMQKRLTRHQQLSPQYYYETLFKVLKHPKLNVFNVKIIPPPPPVPEMSEEEKARLAALALKLKDCCQFYTVKYVEPKKHNDRRQQQKKNDAPSTVDGEGGEGQGEGVAVA